MTIHAYGHRLNYQVDLQPDPPDQWIYDASCHGRTDWFDLAPPTSSERRAVFAAQITERQAICAQCPVIRDCARLALAGGSQDIASGVWAGLLIPFNSGRKTGEIRKAFDQLHAIAGIPRPTRYSRKSVVA